MPSTGKIDGKVAWTAGPWHFDGGADWSIHDASGAVLAEVYDSRETAAIMTAAPDLYEALWQLVYDWEGEPEDVLDARAALAKANPEPSS